MDSSRRSPWTRKRDRVIAVAATLVVAATVVALWAASDSAATHSTLAAGPPPNRSAPAEVPDVLSEVWRERSEATREPVVAGRTVVTGSKGTVTGRDPLGGGQRWSYQRDLPLCTLASGWSNAVAVYRKDSRIRPGCSEVTQLDGDTGGRVSQRNGDAEVGTELIGDGTHLIATGPTLINAWSQNLIRSMEYGDVPARVNPGKQPRSGCRFGSFAVAGGNVAVVERCRDDDSARLTVIGTTNNNDDGGGSDSEQPREVFSELLGSESAHVVTVSDSTDDAEEFFVAVVLGDQEQLAVYDAEGRRASSYALDLPAAELTTDPPGGIVAVYRTDSALYWFTGSATIALDPGELSPRWTLRGTRGPGSHFAGEMLVPVPGGLAVIDDETGQPGRVVEVDRGRYAGPVLLDSVGPVLLEQRGDTLVALR